MNLKDISAGQSLAGVEPTQIVSVVATVPHGDSALQIIYRLPDGTIKERLLGLADEPSINAATAERPFSFRLRHEHRSGNAPDERLDHADDRFG